MIADVLLVVLGVVAVVAAVLVFVVDSMARATYALAVSFVAVGLAVVVLHQTYAGLVIVLMMVMEMAVMAVYMVMYMGMNPALMPMSMVHGKRASLVAAIGCFVLLAAGSLLVPWPTRRGAPSPDVAAALGASLMGSKMLVMVVISPVMVATIVAGVTLALHRGRYDRFGDDLDRRSAADPQPGGVGR